MHLFIAKDWQRASQMAAHKITEFYLQTSGPLAINLATGESPQKLYTHLQKQFDLFPDSKERLHLFHLDEFQDVPYEQSYSQELSAGIVQDWLGASDRFFPWFSEDTPTEQRCQQLQEQWQKMPHRVAILGIGPNGHIGFNEPGSAFFSTARSLELTSSTRQKLEARFSPHNVPKTALGFGVWDIFQADLIILLASGKTKADAIAQALLGPIHHHCPASFLQLHPNVHVFLDTEAADLYQNKVDAYKVEKMLLQSPSMIEGPILCLSPHPDDTSIAAGGTLVRHAATQKVKTVNLYSGHRSEIPGTSLEERIRIRSTEAENEAAILNIAVELPQLKGYDQNYAILEEDIAYLQQTILDWKPKHIFSPKLQDPHPAHAATTQLLLHTLSTTPQLKDISLWLYETPWSLFQPGEMNVFVSLTRDELNTKLKAIGMHQTQVQRTPYDIAAKALSQLRAIVASEQEFSTYGKCSQIELGRNLECFQRIFLA